MLHKPHKPVMAVAILRDVTMGVNLITTVISKAVRMISKLVQMQKNDTHFEMLANRVDDCTTTLKTWKERGVPVQHEVERAINGFSSALDSAEDLLIGYGTSNAFKRFSQSSKLKEKFKSVNQKLKDAEQQLNSALVMMPRSAGTESMGMDLMPFQGGDEIRVIQQRSSQQDLIQRLTENAKRVTLTDTTEPNGRRIQKAEIEYQ
ncbi:uncharacterized protein LOC134089616 isoform X2 [Sardina pilchardus]|uniref:uncharacterized protein LOC134089616 isoform X2 n=1 Tax=Sardina pilchardus TaxID=27697 RepID=UPI002E11DC71